MFQRYIWWRNIGIDSVYFLEDIFRIKKLTNDQLNYATPFTSLNDEDTFLFLTNSKATKHKQFAYLLTENSHLPYFAKAATIDKYIQFQFSLSKEANNQLMRISELLLFFMENIDKTQWPKVLIVGDHAPPFSNASDHSFYSEKSVPFIFLERNNYP